MKRKVIFLQDFKFTKRDYQRFGFEYLESKNLDVYVLDFCYLFNKSYFENHHPHDYFNDFKNYFSIKNEKDFHEFSNKFNSQDIVISIFGFNEKNEFIFKRINECNAKLGFCIFGEHPSPWNRDRESIAYKLLNLLRFIAKDLLKIKKHLKRGFSVDFVITTGIETIRKTKIEFAGMNYRMIEAHSFDYDNFLEGNQLDGYDKNNFAVFLDEDKPFHPDSFILEKEEEINPKKFYYELNRFFKIFEDVTGLEVIIAPHPRADYQKRGNPFSGRKIEEGQTHFLVKNSKHVLSSNSTSLGYAALYRKPVTLVDSNLYGEFSSKHAIAYQEDLGCELVNISDDKSLKKQNYSQDVNEKKYSSYVERYIKNKKSRNVFSWKIILEEILESFN